ncbi:MAG: PAS domain S-box protein, partial [Rhodospirillales bacterium]
MLAEPCLPEPESRLEEDVFAAATELFLDPQRAERSRRALRAAMGVHDLELLTAYLAFIRTAHYWTLTHPDLAPEEDVEALLRDHEELARLLMDDPEAARCDISTRPLDELTELRAARLEYERIDRDATKARLADEASRREREALQTIFDSIPVMITLYDPQVNMLLLNHEVERLTGWSIGNLDGVSIMEACYPDPGYREEVRAFMEACRGWMDIRMRTSEGRFIDTCWANVRLADDRRVGIGIDVSLRKAAEQALAMSEERLRLASDAAGFGVYDFDVTSRRSAWSPQLRRILGRERENGEIPFEETVALIHPEDRADTQARMEEAMRRPGHYEVEFRIVRPDGSVRWVLDRGETFAAEGAPDGLARRGAGTLIDITDRKLAEERLRESEGRFREMADNLPLIVWMHDAEGNLEFVNQTYCDYFGLRRKDMHTDRWRVLVHPDDAPGYVGEFLACVRERRPFNAECRVLRADGEWRWTEAWGRLRLDHTGAFLGHIGTSADITERKEAEARLRESEQRFRGIYENAGTGIAIAHLNGRFQSCNSAYAAMLGYSEEELRHMVSFELVHPEDRAQNMAEMERLLARKAPSVEILNRYVAKDGRPIWVHKHVSMLRDASGKFTHLIALVTDMTERKRADEHRQLLVNELNHRVKNTLAVVQAIAQQTSRGPEGPEDLFTAFQNRLAALAAAHNLLSRLNWEQASLEELARETTAASFAEAERIRM